MSATVTTDDVRALVEDYVTVLRWHSDYGEAECPGGHQDAWVHLKSPPYLHCLHERCASDVAAVNAELREAFVDFCAGRDIKIDLSPEDKAKLERRKYLRSIENTARILHAPKLLIDIPVETWIKSSPVLLEGWPLQRQWQLMVGGLFEPNDLIWMGDLGQSGREYRHCFRTVQEWIEEMDIAPGEQLCAAPFKAETKLFTEQRQSALVDHKELRPIGPDDDPELAARDCVRVTRTAGRALLGTYLVKGEYRRAAKYLRERPYFILESDTLTRERFGSLVRYAQKYTTLRSMVDTAGWGIHAALDLPNMPCDRLQEFYAVLVGLGADRKTLVRACPTTRLPGAKRLDEQFNVIGWQKLLYLHPKYTI